MPYFWFQCFFIFACLCIDHVFTLPSSYLVSYTKHCSSIVPEYNITTLISPKSIPPLSTTFFTGGDSFLRREPGRDYSYVQKSLRLLIRPDMYYRTTAAGVYKVEGILTIYSGSSGNYISGSGNQGQGGGSIEFPMNGFWSEKSKKLCMLGSAPWNGIGRDAVLKVKYEDEIPTIYTSVVSGILESTAASANDPSYFDPVFIFIFLPVPNYYFSLVRKEAFSSDSDDSLRFTTNEFCLAIERGVRNLEVEYAAECTSCSPVETSPRFLSLDAIDCPERERKGRFMATFHNHIAYTNYYDFDVGSTLIGEFSWDDESRKMIGVACRISNPLSDELGNVVRNCTIMLSLSFPSVMNIRNDARVVGQISSSSSVDDFGYFDKISFRNNDEYHEVVMPGQQQQRYEYTEMDRVRKLCPSKKPTKKGNMYPHRHSYNMKFDMVIKHGQGQPFVWANAKPSWVGNNPYDNGMGALPPVDSFPEFATILQNLRNTSSAEMSYKIRIDPYDHGNSSNFSSFSWTVNPNQGVEITAEGMYETENGFLCMVGCRKVNSTFKDCDMVVEMEFPPLNGKNGALIKGMIRSTRATNDALHFHNLIIESAATYVEEIVRSIWRMDFEIIMVLISNTLVCIFVALQIFHVRRNHEVPSFISLVMLAILCIEHMIPFMLDFDAVYLGNHDKQALAVGNGGRLQANEVAVRVITMVTLLLQLRLLQLVWTSKQSDNNGKFSWVGEIKAGFVSSSLYILGWFFKLLINWMRKAYVSPYSSLARHYSVWNDLRSYAGLILDAFLVPQIMLNILRGSAEKALCHPFYAGTSAVRLVPHIYNLYRTHNYPKNDLNATYYYANPAADFYSTAWDIIIPIGIVVLAVIVFLQQRLGGRCVLPKRFGAFRMYEKLPSAADYQ